MILGWPMSGILFDTGKVFVTIVANTVIASKTVTPETLKQEMKLVWKFNLKDDKNRSQM